MDYSQFSLSLRGSRRHLLEEEGDEELWQKLWLWYGDGGGGGDDDDVDVDIGAALQVGGMTMHPWFNTTLLSKTAFMKVTSIMIMVAESGHQKHKQ